MINQLLETHLKNKSAKWMQNINARTYSIEPHKGKWRLLIIDGLIEKMLDRPHEALKFVYFYNTEEQADRDVDELNDTRETHGIYLLSL